MKLALSLLGLATVAAFAPAAKPSSSTTALSALGEVPSVTGKERVPCFGATPLIGEPKFFGETWWDKITLEWGSEATGKYVQAAEIKHGRSAMLATVGFAFHKLGLTLDKISPHEYLSVTQGVKFADLAAMTPAEAIHAVPAAGLVQMFCAIAAVEIYELTHKDGSIQYGQSVAPGLQAGGLTGDLGYNPLKIKVTDRRRLVEIQNGRAAMFAISAWVAHDAIAGSVPLTLPWN
jgi:Chlorophyll A-B binding protein